MKVLFVIGTRPEAIKLAPVVLECKQKKGIEALVCSTGQHKELLDSAFEQWCLVPDIELEVMQAGQGLNELLSKLLSQLDMVLSDTKPDCVVVQGDTSSCLAGALASFQREIPVYHVEAGLRTYDKSAPFPEELNRQMVSRIAHVHFAPTEKNKQALLREGISDNDILVTGNTVIDALIMCQNKMTPESNPEIQKLQGIYDPQKKLLLVTGHRRENMGAGFLELIDALRELASDPSLQIIIPLHLNPAVREPMIQALGKTEGIYLIEALGYEAFIWLMSKSFLIISDSGGVQEEAPSLNKPVLVLREQTEREEVVEAGTVRLIGTRKEAIVHGVQELIEDEDKYIKMTQKPNPYGDGMAAKRIVDFLASVQ
tara:strand:- start:30041 stop:31153 length:1113 start_codon:yes stop_codon:yes gene_type:complete